MFADPELLGTYIQAGWQAGHVIGLMQRTCPSLRQLGYLSLLLVTACKTSSSEESVVCDDIWHIARGLQHPLCP